MIVYGDEGQPAGSIIDDVLYWTDGDQIGFLDNGYIFRSSDGQWVGSFVSGVVFNAFQTPVGFAANCTASLALVPPKIQSMLPSRLKATGPDVRGLPSHTIPSFLKGRLEPQKMWMMI